MNRKGRIIKKRFTHFDIPFMTNLLRLPHHEFVKRLDEMDCDLMNHNNKCKEIPLHELIKQGINVNAKNEDGTSRLENAIEDDNIEETCMLLYYGADVNTPNEFNQKPLDIALTNYNLNIALTLVNYCDDLSATNVYNIFIALVSKDSTLTGRLLINSKSEEILVKYFKQFSRKIYSELISNTRVQFLADYIHDCDYSGPNFLDCLNSILSLPNSKLLVQNFKRKYNTDNFHNLLNAFSEKKIKRRDRTAMIWTWASLGAQVNIMNINVALYLYGFNEEVEALIYSAGAVKVCCLRILPLSIFILGLEENFSSLEIFETFLGFWYQQGIPELISFSRCNIDFDAKKIVLNSLRYFSIPDRIKKVFLKEFKNTTLYCLEIVQMIKRLPRIPTLVELSRDQARRHIRKAYGTKYPYQFHTVVKSLNVPLNVKDIIRFKKPIYY